MDVSLNDIQSLIRAVQESDVSELILERGDFKLTLRKPAVGAPAPARPAEAAPMAAPAPVASAPAPAAAPAPAPTAPAKPALTINAPMVGTFYRSPSPDAGAFVEVGDVVKPGQVVCIIEAMKLMNELESELSGRVARFLVENGEPVEYGQPLIALDPA
ncbi:Biotin carboxyl carrier protein of acetyl-CoA carboxylase [compost metagenome]